MLPYDDWRGLQYCGWSVCESVVGPFSFCTIQNRFKLRLGDILEEKERLGEVGRTYE